MPVELLASVTVDRDICTGGEGKYLRIMYLNVQGVMECNMQIWPHSFTAWKSMQ